MKLENVRIQHYRSADDVCLTEIGNLNVLIGKNNSGKSTVLSSIDIFFRCIQGARVVSLSPPAGRTVDFCQQQTTEPILITLAFSLSLAERDAVVLDIATEAPQLKNAVDGLDPSLWLEASLAITPEPQNYSYLKSLVFVGPGDLRASAPRRTMLDIGHKAALELVSKQQTMRAANQGAEEISRMLSEVDEEDFMRVIQRIGAEPPGAALRFLPFFRRGPVSRSTIATIEPLFKDSPSYPEFRTRAASARDQFVEQGKQAQQDPLKNTIETFSGEQSTIPAYALNLVRSISEMRVLYLTERREPVGKAEARQLLSFKVTRGGPEKLRNIQQTIASLLSVQVDAFESVAPSTTEKSAEMDVDNFLLEVNGSGIKEALRLVLDVEFKKPSILLVEEPEVHLHPALETNMMGYLKRISSGCQVFLSTHSTNFLDTTEMKNVYFISKPQGKTEIQLLNLEEAESILPQELGIRLSSLFMFDRLVFVEGPSDEGIIREWASTLGVNLSQANVGFLSMGGVRNFTHYAQGGVIAFLTRRQVRVWFLIDRDERDAKEIEKLQERLQGRATVEVLPRREIENYLLVARPLEQFIRVKQNMLTKGKYPQVSQAAIHGAIAECAEELKDHAIGKRVVKRLCRPIYPTMEWKPEDEIKSAVPRLAEEFGKLRQQINQMEKEAETCVEESRALVDGSWHENKTHLVPGDELLDRVFRKFAVRFKKESDGSRIAALMSESEIDADIKRIVHSLAG